MKRAANARLLRNVILKSMGLILAPLTFVFLIAVIAVLMLRIAAGDLMGYGQMLLLDLPDATVSASEFELPELALPPDTPEATEAYVDIADIDFPVYEQVYGEISIESAGILCPLIYGDTNKALAQGAGQYIGSRIIGYGGTTMVCAHVNRHFNTLNKVQVGDEIMVRTRYGVYFYKVTYVGVHEYTDESVYDLTREDENLVLYTCFYDYSGIGSVKKRLFVCADYVSGPMIRDGGGEA